jgi:hypothetical protein
MAALSEKISTGFSSSSKTAHSIICSGILHTRILF